MGDSVAALRHAFTLAGTRAVVATSWDVDVIQATPLVKTFIDQRPTGGNAERPLESSARSDREEIHPFHWASFSLTGLEY